MATPKQFDARIQLLANRINGNAEKLVRRVAVVVDQVVTTATPVDTGRARSNWQASVDAPAAGVVAPIDTSGQSAIAKARAIISGFKSRVNRDIHITNNVDYIRKLENGSSAQAPQGMVRQAVQAGREAIKNTKLMD